jgi:hypothetical protein
LPGVAEVERAQQAQRAASARCSKAEEQLSQARQAESSAHQRHIHLEHTLGEQVCGFVSPNSMFWQLCICLDVGSQHCQHADLVLLICLFYPYSPFDFTHLLSLML